VTLYTPADEERIRLQAHVREWTQAGLLEEIQGEALAAELRTDLRRTNTMLRAVFAFFAAIVIAASVGFVFLAFDIDGRAASAMVTGVAAVACFAAAHLLVARLRLYRYGVEEALALASVLLAYVTGALLAAPSDGQLWTDISTVAGLVAAIATSMAVYRHFGFVYAAGAAMALAACIPFALNFSESVERLGAAAIFGGCFVLARALHSRHGDDYPGDDYGVVQSAAWAGLYFAMNLYLDDGAFFGLRVADDPRWFHWTTYFIIWAMPIAGLWMAVRDKDRWFIRVNLVLVLATLVTNKSYLGWPRYSWDPMILGVGLVVAALWTRRWLAAGVGGQRNGYTPERILESDRDTISALGTASSVMHPQSVSSHPAREEQPGFGGGRSGGAGASGGW
jgi:hypothetical protein